MDGFEKTENPSFLLYMGDCHQIMRQIPDNSVDAVITDPPYSSGGLHQGDRTKAPSQKYVGHDVQIKRADFSGDNKTNGAGLFGVSCG
jgi:site-specific DNA-methyltransferase (adenine-specific)